MLRRSRKGTNANMHVTDSGKKFLILVRLWKCHQYPFKRVIQKLYKSSTVDGVKCNARFNLSPLQTGLSTVVLVLSVQNIYIMTN
jgi:hypothetical protein